MPTIKYVEWKERYSVGNSTLDADHKILISIINDLYVSVQNHDEQHEIKEILDRLLKYTMTHFKREERLLEKIEYPDLNKHNILHRRMAQRTKELIELFLENDNSIPLETMDFLKDWWIDHIVVTDIRYKPFIEKAKDTLP